MNLPDAPSTSNPAGHPKVGEEKQPQSTTQRTATGYEIPVPPREDFDQLLDQAAKKRPPDSSS
jgi:hypothetical protein